MWEFVSSFDAVIIRIALWATAICGLLTILFGVLIIFLRLAWRRRKRRTDTKIPVWHQLLVDSLTTDSVTPPELSRTEVIPFLFLWNYVQESLRDDKKTQLNNLARNIGLDKWAARALRKNDLRKRLLALQTIGWLRDSERFDDVAEFCSHPSPTLSLAAARSLMRIDSLRAIDIFLPLVIERGDWSYATVGKILMHAHADDLSKPMIETALNAPDERAPRLIRFMRLTHIEVSSDGIRTLMERTKNPEVIMSCLRVLRDPSDLEYARGFLTHEDWRIRAQAAACLGRIGTAEDVARLAHACGDQKWWVRSRAAKALADLPSVSLERLKKLAEGHHNFYAQDVINKVFEERRVLI